MNKLPTRFPRLASCNLFHSEPFLSCGYIKTKTLCNTVSSYFRGSLSLDKHGNTITCCRTRDCQHHTLWSSAIQIQESLSVGLDSNNGSNLQSLNLSHNSFTTVPVGLPCLAVSLTRLNLSYNR